MVHQVPSLKSISFIFELKFFSGDLALVDICAGAKLFRNIAPYFNVY